MNGGSDNTANRPLVDDRATTVAWQKLARPIAVLPVGAMEQHGGHLPVGIDAIMAAKVAAVVARELQAALLPALPYGQSYEHTGFRGTFSLRPETFMAVIRDLADELQQQNFTRLIIVNGHGGNWALPTVVRDINRHDRPLRIVLTNYWEYDRTERRAGPGGDIHAGAEETSRVLAWAPELVGALPDDSGAGEGEPGAIQSDLNHLGLGVLRPDGPWGFPREATAQRGHASFASIVENLLPAVRLRLEWFDRHPSYAGAGPIVSRPMETGDIPAGLVLCAASGWNQTAAEWGLFLRANPELCFVAQHNGRVVGTVTGLQYGPVIWVAMVLVDGTLRRRGIGTQMLRAVLAAAGSSCLELDATPAGKRIYDRLGFVDQGGVSRMMAPAWTADRPPLAGCRPMRESDLDAVVALDGKSFGVPRAALIRWLFATAPEAAVVAQPAGGPVAGFAFGRRGTVAGHIGPVAAPDADTARRLTGAVAVRLEGCPILIDVPDGNADWRSALMAAGFSEQRRFIRMVRGADPHPGRGEFCFATGGPEFG